MKSYGGLWEKIVSKENVELAVRKALRGKKKKGDVIAFLADRERKTEEVRKMLEDETFHTGRYRTFEQWNGKHRTIHVLPFFPDRIVHHCVMNVLAPIMERHLIDTTYSCIPGRGIHSASLKLMEYTRKNDYALQLDVRKFFPSIPHRELSCMLHRLCRERKVRRLLDDIVYSWEGDRNCPLGNFTSQWFGNWFLHGLDNFVRHTLKCGCYVRYCDDMCLLGNDKRVLAEWRDRAVDYVNGIGLELGYAEIVPTGCGIDFCGYVHFKDHKELRPKTARRQLGSDGDKESLTSSLAHDRHCCSYRHRKLLEERYVLHLEKQREHRICGQR